MRTLSKTIKLDDLPKQHRRVVLEWEDHQRDPTVPTVHHTTMFNSEMALGHLLWLMDRKDIVGDIKFTVSLGT